MKLTPFGEAVRIQRMRLDLSLKQMAEAMGISSAHLSSIEFGEKRLLQKHIDATLSFFRDKVSKEQLRAIQEAAEQSKDTVDTSALSMDSKGFVAAFARRLGEGSTPPKELVDWINKQTKKD